MKSFDLGRINVDKPLYDLKTFAGRFSHFAWMTDPRTCITSNEKLHEAKRLVDKYRIGQEPKGTTKEQIKYAMKLYTSAFHPDSGELQNFCGRMSFQVSLFRYYFRNVCGRRAFDHSRTNDMNSYLICFGYNFSISVILFVLCQQ